MDLSRKICNPIWINSLFTKIFFPFFSKKLLFFISAHRLQHQSQITDSLRTHNGIYLITYIGIHVSQNSFMNLYTHMHPHQKQYIDYTAYWNMLVALRLAVLKMEMAVRDQIPGQCCCVHFSTNELEEGMNRFLLLLVKQQNSIWQQFVQESRTQNCGESDEKLLRYLSWEVVWIYAIHVY